MTLLEDEIRRSLQRLDTLDVPAVPIGKVRDGAHRVRRRRGLAAAFAAVIVVAGSGLGLQAFTSGDGPTRQPAPPPPVGAPVTDWQRLGTVPLSRRDPGIVANVSGRLVVLGGLRLEHCPKGAFGCTPRQVAGGAVFDPATKAWTAIPMPPRELRRPVNHYSLWAVDGQRLVLLSGSFPMRVIAYDLDARTWRGYAPPPVELTGNDLLAAGGGQAFVADQDDHDGGATSSLMRLDLDSGEWTQLPASPHTPRLTVRAAFVTPAGLLVAGLYGLDPDDRHYRAGVEVYADGKWHRYPDPDVQASGYAFHWTARRLVAPFLFHGGHGVALDPMNGRWARLPVQPPAGSQGWPVGSSAGGGLVTEDGLLFDLATGQSRALQRPEGAARVAGGGFVGRHLYVVDARSQLWEATP